MQPLWDRQEVFLPTRDKTGNCFYGLKGITTLHMYDAQMIRGFDKIQTNGEVSHQLLFVNSPKLLLNELRIMLKTKRWL